MKCLICKIGETRPGKTAVTFERDSMTLVIKGVPAEVCANCGEAYVDEEVSRRILEAKVALPDFTGRCTTEIIPLLPADSTDRYYLAWLLRRDETVVAAMRQRTGSRMPRADMDDLLSLEIPFPPPEEQRRIAGILNEQMASAERARKGIEEELDAINKLPAALLRRAFAGEL